MKPISLISRRDDTTHGVALHRQIYMVLREEIERGLYPDQSFPSYDMLCSRFGVSRITVRRAVNDLASEGFVEQRQGTGTFVKQRPIGSSRAPSLSIVDQLQRAVPEVKMRVLEVVTEMPPQDVVQQLDLRDGEQAVRILRLRLDGRGEPGGLIDVWVPARLSAGLTRTALRRRGVYEVLMEQGVTFGRVVQMFTATVCDPERAPLLGVSVGAPLLKLLRVIHDNKGRPVQYLISHFPANRASVLMETTGESVNTLSGGMIFLDTPEPDGPNRR